MDDPAPGTNWFTHLLGIVVTILGWIGAHIFRKVDRHEKLLSHAITREEFREYLEAIRKERCDMHDENSDRLNSIAVEQHNTNLRIDAILSKGRR